MPHLLIVDDDEAIAWGVARIGEELGCAVVSASSAEEALERAARQKFDAVVLDVRMPGLSGLEALPRLKSLVGDVPIIVMTAFGDLQTAVTAVRQGAFEYLLKPFDRGAIREILRRALSAPGEAAPVAVEEAEMARPVGGFVGQSPAMQHVFARVALAAASDANVVVAGESGSGKELVAEAIHRFSPRSSGPFVPVHLASLNPSLIESELFGHVRGAFTGAEQQRPGWLLQANGGTLFLDEIAEIPVPIQVKLLRSIEQKMVAPVGGQQPVASDFRVIAATHRDLERMVAAGEFRHDLFFRLAAFRIDVPPLRDRPEDVLPLTRYFLRLFGKAGPAAIRGDTLAELARRPWWGNVRELRNAIEHAVIVARGGPVAPEHLPPPRPRWQPDAPQDSSAQLHEWLRAWTDARLAGSEAEGELHEALLRLVEVPVLQALLRQFHGQIAPAAKYLGLHRTTLRKKLADYGLLASQD